MLIRVKHRGDIRPSEITAHTSYLNRRRFIQAAIAAGLFPGLLTAPPAQAGRKLQGVVKSPFSVDEKPTPYDDVTQYNNFYEFGTSKSDPANRAHTLRTSPWSVTVDGEAEKTGTFTLEDLLKPHTLEERIYRFRCVEAWSMVIPWVGIPLADVLKRFQPTSRAKYVEFTTLHDPQQMPGQRSSVLQWPYVEGLRMDEAMHPLAILVVGVYGEVLPNQNGAPLRLMAPWKYGFKNVKSIVRIRFTEQMPRTTWALAAPREYGFYANVNPAVDHPRWSQKTERRIGSGSLFNSRQKTLPFNGYAEQVAHLYAGMDLRKYF